jgi:hypothetical protein
MMKRILVLALLLVGFTAGAQSFESTFVQTKTLKLTGKKIVSEGSIVYTAPDNLAMLYTKPDGDYFIVDGPLLRFDLRGVSLDVNTDNNRTVRLQRNAIMYGIQGKYKEIAQEMEADYTESSVKGGKHVAIKVRKPAPKGYTGMELDYNAKGRLTRMVLEEAGGISTEYLVK